MAKVTIELTESEMEYLQKVANSRAGTKNPIDYENDFEDYAHDEPYDLTFRLIDQAIEQGVITPAEPSVVTRLWWNIEALIGKERARNRLITAKFKEFEWKRVNDEELFAFTAAHPSPFDLFSESLKYRGLEVGFELTEGYPFVKFSKGEKERKMMDFTDEAQGIMLEVSTDLLSELDQQDKRRQK